MKKTERADKIFGTNYKLVIGAFLFLIFAMPMVLFFFEHKSYVEEKRGAPSIGFSRKRTKKYSR